MINIESVIASIFNMFAVMLIWYKFLNRKINFLNIKIYIALIILVLISLFNYYTMNPFIRVLLFSLSIMIVFKIYFKENLKISVLTVILEQMIVMISEILVAIVISLYFKLNSNDMINSQFGTLFANIIISIVAVGISYIPLIKKFYKFLIKITDKIKSYQLIILSFVIILIGNISGMILYYKVEFAYLLIFNTFLTLFSFSIVLYSFKTKNNYLKVYDKYNTTLNSLKEYENILDRYRISNHENKNQMLTIRNMIPKNNKKVKNYIDTIVENKIKDNDRIMLEATKIPAGGLRGLIYSKILQMNNLNINYELEISNEIRTVDLINNIDDFTMLDICKIIGVYLDNSIQAVEKLEEKYINIEMYLQDSNLIISISNNYEGIIELDKLEQKGYTSKGLGHGYGLSLTKEIINNNKKLLNEKSINRDTFTQILKIKM